MQLGIFEAHVPDAYLDAGERCFLKKGSKRVSAKCCLHRECASFNDRAFEQMLPFVPCSAVCFFLRDGWICGKNALCGFIRIEILGATLAKHGAANAALASAIRAGQNVDARIQSRLRHACAQRLLQLCQVPWVTRRMRTASRSVPSASACGRAWRQIRR